MLYMNLLILFWQDWFAFHGNGSDFNFTLVGEAVFPNSGAPTVDNNYGFCQVSVSDMHLSVTLLKYEFVCLLFLFLLLLPRLNSLVGISLWLNFSSLRLHA